MNIRLVATPEHPPLEMHERYTHKANYPTTLAFLHVYLDGTDVTADISSAYMLLLLDHLLAGIGRLLKGDDANAEWFSDPWTLRMHPLVTKDRLFLTLDLGHRPTPLKNVEISLDQFVQEVINLAKKWREYLEETYSDEIFHPEKGEQFRRFEQHLKNAELAWKNSSKMIG